MKYQEEKTFLLKVEDINSISNIRTIATKEEIEVIRYNNPNIPIDFLLYLYEIGSGSFREGQFNITSYLFSLDDLGLDYSEYIPTHIKFFGDNFCGDFAGFDLSNKKDEVVEFWHDSYELNYTEKTFQQYIREQMLMDDNANDLRVS